MASHRFFQLRTIIPDSTNELTEPSTVPAAYTEIQTDREWLVQDNDDHWDGFTATSTSTGQRFQIRYNWTGTTGTNTATTWDFAPLCEQREVEPDNYEQFRDRLHTDDSFVGRQVLWNQRLDRFHQRGHGNGWQQHGLHMYTASGTDTAGTWWISSDVDYWHNKEPTRRNRIEYQLKVIIPHMIGVKTKKVFKSYRKIKKWWKSREMLKAEKKSMELMEKWLEPHEIKGLMERGELEIFFEDVTYIVKKNPHETVTRVKDGKKSEFCIIPSKQGYASGDVLLSKILLIKTNPKRFEEIAIKRT